jgi:hypothetical protein
MTFGVEVPAGTGARWRYAGPAGDELGTRGD